MTEPMFLLPLETFMVIREWGDDSSRWSWRCGLVKHRREEGYLDGACQCDHNVDDREQLISELLEHLARWHSIRPVDGAALHAGYVYAHSSNDFLSQLLANAAVEAIRKPGEGRSDG